jgi:hypothetical protein
VQPLPPIPTELDPLESDELEPEVAEAPDGLYRVRFPLVCGDCGDTIVVTLDPNDARYMAYQLNRAAAEADAKNKKLPADALRTEGPS